MCPTSAVIFMVEDIFKVISLGIISALYTLSVPAEVLSVEDAVTPSAYGTISVLPLRV